MAAADRTAAEKSEKSDVDVADNVVKLLIIQADRARTADGRVGMREDELRQICEEVGENDRRTCIY